MKYEPLPPVLEQAFQFYIEELEYDKALDILKLHLKDKRAIPDNDEVAFVLQVCADNATPEGFVRQRDIRRKAQKLSWENFKAALDELVSLDMIRKCEPIQGRPGRPATWYWIVQENLSGQN